MVEKAVLRNVPEISYIKQPYNLTFMRGELSNMQLSAVIEVMDQMQDRVEKWLGMGTQQKELQPSLFSKEELEAGIPAIRIPLSSLGVLPQYYDRLEDAVRSMTSQTIEYESTIDGQPSKVFAPLFKRIAIPRRSVLNERAIEGKVEAPSKHTPRRGSFIEIDLNTEIVPYLFNMKQYNKYIKEVARNCSLYTSRIYMCITAKKYSQTGIWEISYSEFRQIMGADRYDNATRKWVTAKYPVYTDFRKRVLNGAMKELKELEERGEVDCYFTYEEVFPGGIRRGNPDRLRFFIHITEMGKLEQARTEIAKGKIEIQQYMRQNFRFNLQECNALLRLVDDEHLSEMLKKCHELKQYLDEHQGKIEKPKSYAFVTMKSWVENLIPVAEESPVEMKTETDDLAQMAQAEPEIIKSENPENRKKWDSFMERLQEYSVELDWDVYLKYMEFGSLQDNELTICVPSEFVCEKIQNDFSVVFYKAFDEIFPKDVQIFFSINK